MGFEANKIVFTIVESLILKNAQISTKYRWAEMKAGDVG